MTNHRGNTRSVLLGASAIAGALALMATPAAAQQARYDFDLPAQPLETALEDFARTANQQLIFADTDVRGRSAPAVRGAYSPEDALQQLLAGTDLKVRRTASGVVQIAADQGPQGGSAAGNAVQALIVTAQKREEDIQDVPIAISAFSQEDLTRSQIAGGPDLITQVPNMTFTKTNFSSYSVQLRGIGTQAISATTDPAVAVAFNNTPFIRNRFFEQEFYDMERVEVLRGPQGTLYGRNATAGVVNLISAKPKFYAEAKASADISNYSSSRLEAMVNVPLVEDVAALRIAGAWTKRDGYATNQLSGSPIDGRDLWSTRVSLRISPSDAVDVNLIWEHFEESDDRLRSGKQLCKKDVVTEVGGIATPNYYQTLPNPGQNNLLSGVQATFSQGCARDSLYSSDSFQTPNGLMLPYYAPLGLIGLPINRDAPYVSEVQSPDLRVIESSVDPKYTASSDIGELQFSVALGDHLTLQSETAYGTDTVYSLQDFNRFNTAAGAWKQPSPAFRENLLLPGPNGGGIFCDPQLGCSDRLVAVDISTAKASQFSQEIRFSSDFDGAFNFSVGANYLRADSEDKYYVFINSISLYAAAALQGGGGLVADVDPYAPGLSDNSECLLNGYAPGDPGAVFPVTSCVYLDPNPIEQVNDQGHNYFLSKNPYKLISYAAFGEAYYNLSDALKITAGLRWTVDKKSAPRIPTWILASNSYGYPVAEVIEQEWREPTGRLTVDWKPDLPFTDETMVYGSYAHGYKAGGTNPPGFVRVFYADPSVALDNSTASATKPKTFDAEFVDAFEIGTKNTLADGRVTLNLAAFYYDYRDYQISEIVDRSAFNRNFDATVWGVELEADWRPLENLRLGFKGGYQKTRIADGEEAIDLMDRTAGRDDWVVVRPFPTYASSCILPVTLFNYTGSLTNPAGVSGGNPSACEEAYLQGLDPVTDLPYEADPFPGYEGFNPFDESQGHNFGEGFNKPLGGNELPNAPNWTATITADYTIPLPNAWLATLHTDLHWQAESWWRIFNDHEYGKLDEYFTANIAAIFTNEENGWNIMAYVKNVTDETAITGAFLNSDDTGLTTNVFLTEPRLYGLRITKRWDGGPLLGSFGERREGPYAFTIELGGQVQRHSAPNEALRPAYADEFQGPLDIFNGVQGDDLDWGDGREVKLTWRPDGDWAVFASLRRSETGSRTGGVAQTTTDPVCVYGAPYDFLCAFYANDPVLGRFTRYSQTNRADASVWDREDHQIADAGVTMSLSGGWLGASSIGAGLRHVRLHSRTSAELRGVPDWDIPEGAFPAENVVHTVYDIAVDADREFSGAGPMVYWNASVPLLENAGLGRIDLDWSVSGGVIFGDQETDVAGTQVATLYDMPAGDLFNADSAGGFSLPTQVTTAPQITYHRTQDVTVPMAGVSLGLSFKSGGATFGAGYRWERYFDAIDGGYDTAQDADRTIDGPYFKIAVGFGG